MPAVAGGRVNCSFVLENCASVTHCVNRQRVGWWDIFNN